MNEVRRILVLWSRPSGYVDACLAALAGTGKAEVLFVGQLPSADEAPFDLSQMSANYRSVYLEKSANFDLLASLAADFEPNIVLSGGSWREPFYRRLLRNIDTKTCRVLCADTQWHGGLRQWTAVALMYVLRELHYDVAFVAGSRQRTYAEHLGFERRRIRTGLYACDYDAFSAAASRAGSSRFASPSFLFAGRLISIKGLPELLEGYGAYRRAESNPWPLDVCGVGPLEADVRSSEGVRYIGFVQPNDLPDTMARHTTLVAPSRVEPWGLVVHEAASAGMSVICSQECGSSDDFVRDGRNGVLLPRVDPETICNALVRISGASEIELVEMSVTSSELASCNSPAIWARRVLEFCVAD